MMDHVALLFLSQAQSQLCFYAKDIKQYNDVLLQAKFNLPIDVSVFSYNQTIDISTTT